MKVYQIGKRQQQKCWYRTHRDPFPSFGLRGMRGLGRLLPGHRLYKPTDSPIGYRRYLGYASFPE